MNRWVVAISRRYIIVQADDLGLSVAFNEGILEAYKGGVLTGATIRTNGSAFQDAVDRIIPDCPKLGIGIHLNIVEGHVDLANIGVITNICDYHGKYKSSFVRFLKDQLFCNDRVFVEIEDDYRRQIEIALSKGIKLDHISSHQHTHGIPRIFAIICKLALEYEIPFVRHMREPFYFGGSLLSHATPWYGMNLAKHMILNSLSLRNRVIARNMGVKTNDYFLGIAYTGHMDQSTFINGLRVLDKIQGGVIEVLLHPCKVLAGQSQCFIAPYLKKYVSDPCRASELAALTSEVVKDFVYDNGWTLTSYSTLSQRENGICRTQMPFSR